MCWDAGTRELYPLHGLMWNRSGANLGGSEALLHPWGTV
jgi:hypothetical protein